MIAYKIRFVKILDFFFIANKKKKKLREKISIDSDRMMMVKIQI